MSQSLSRALSAGWGDQDPEPMEATDCYRERLLHARALLLVALELLEPEPLGIDQ